MNYNDAINFIHGTLKFGSKLGLHNITLLLDLMGNPHKKLKFVHIAGTNGKGSTAAYISSIIMEAGYKVGVFTSPYLERFSERIRIGNDEIDEQDVARLTEFVKGKIDIMLSRNENHPTEFEIVTAIALQYYYENNCDIVVLEVGLGGRFDSTNVIDTPLAAVITTISYDHMAILGDTLSKIAFEKAGIIKPDGDVIIYPQPEEVERVFSDICDKRGARLIKVDLTSLNITGFGPDGQTFDYEERKLLGVSLLGDHQVKNAVVALKTTELLKNKGYNITENAIRKGLQNARWPGRLEIVNKNPLFIIDGAHNIEGAKILSKALGKYFPDRRKIFIFGVLRDKDFNAVLEAVAPIADRFITVTPKSDRALKADDLAIIVKSYCNNVQISDTIEDAIRTSMKVAADNDLICAFGSLYYIGEIRRYFREGGTFD